MREKVSVAQGADDESESWKLQSHDLDQPVYCSPFTQVSQCLLVTH